MMETVQEGARAPHHDAGADSSFHKFAAQALLGVGLLAFSLTQLQLIGMPKMPTGMAKMSTTLNSASETAKSNVRDETLMPSTGAKCLSFDTGDDNVTFNDDNKFDELVAAASNIIITMPAKASSTSLKKFSEQCGGMYGHKLNHFLHGRLWVEGEERDKFLRDSLAEKYQVPKVLASHMGGSEAFLHLIKNAPRQMLIVYVHREESSRLISAIRQVASISLCQMQKWTGHGLNLTVDEANRCTIHETGLLDYVIADQKMEIGGTAGNTISCAVFDAIEDVLPTMVFVNYKQADRLQQAIANYHCPDMVDTQIHANVRTKTEEITSYRSSPYGKIKEINIILENGEGVVPLEDWMKMKGDMLRFTLGLTAENKEGKTCQRKIRTMEDDLLACKDEVIQVTKDTSF